MESQSFCDTFNVGTISYVEVLHHPFPDLPRHSREAFDDVLDQSFLFIGRHQPAEISRLNMITLNTSFSFVAIGYYRPLSLVEIGGDLVRLNGQVRGRCLG